MQTVIPLEPGRYYHVYHRGVNRANIFIEERNYAYLLDLYAKHIAPVADTYSYCLLRNHFGMLVRIRTHRVDSDRLVLPGKSAMPAGAPPIMKTPGYPHPLAPSPPEVGEGESLYRPSAEGWERAG